MTFCYFCFSVETMEQTNKILFPSSVWLHSNVFIFVIGFLGARLPLGKGLCAADFTMPLCSVQQQLLTRAPGPDSLPVHRLEELSKF